jgi:hypothetical protein
MVVIDRVYAGGAVQTTTATAFTPTVPGAGGTFTVADATGYPASGKFVVKLNRGLSDEEKVLVDSRSGTTFTVGQRGYDGTTAQDHTTPSVEIVLDAVAVNQMVQHVDDVEADPHSTKLLNNARHDVTARHTFGAALGTPGTPAALTPDIAGSAGVGSVPARSDHVHNIPAAVPVAVGTALAEGAGTSFARDNHVHTIGAGAINLASMFAAGVVDAAAIATDAVGALELGNDAVATANILNDAVTEAKIGIGAPVNWDASQTFEGPFSPTAVFGRYYELGRLIVHFAGFTGGSMLADIAVNLPFANAGGFDGVIAARARKSGGSSGSGLGIIVDGESQGKNFVSIGTAEWGVGVPFTWDASSTFRSIAIYVRS